MACKLTPFFRLVVFHAVYIGFAANLLITNMQSRIIGGLFAIGRNDNGAVYDEVHILEQHRPPNRLRGLEDARSVCRIANTVDPVEQRDSLLVQSIKARHGNPPLLIRGSG